MTKKTVSLTALVASLIATSSSFSQSSTDPLEEIIVVANRIPVPLKQIGTSVSIIDQADIIARGNQTITDVIRQLPAISATRTGGVGAATSIRIRGEEGYRTLVRFDGLKLADPSGVQVLPQMEHIMSSGIDRVEVLRGPQGLSFGADAGGVVNITSRRGGEGINANLDTQTGSFGTTQVSGDLSGGNAITDFFISASSLRVDGFNARVSDNVRRDDDGYENDTVHARFGLNISENLRVDLVHRDVDADSQFDGCFGGDNDCNSIYELQATRLGAVYSTDAMSHSIAYSTTESDRDSLALGVSGFSSLGELQRWEYVGQLSDLSGFDLVFGADLEEENNNGVTRDNTGYYVEALSDFSDKLFLTAGIRQDDNDDFGEHTSYRATAAYLIDMGGSNTLKLKASLGTGFRAPAPSEVAYNAGAFAFPPASLVTLKEENSQGFEAGIEYFGGSRVKLEATYFDQEIEDAIFFDLAGFSGYLQDIGTSVSKGVELSGNIMLSSTWNVQANYTYNDTERPNGLQRLRRPEGLFNVGVSYVSNNSRLRFNAFYRSSEDSIDEVRGTVVSLENFGVLDINATYQVTENVEIYARVENLLDEEYQEVFDFNSTDRGSYVGFRLNF
ncbi:MAG: TonB-dependent receptor plug domain-containing protein [Pseudohongiellaceae bacterium]